MVKLFRARLVVVSSFFSFFSPVSSTQNSPPSFRLYTHFSFWGFWVSADVFRLIFPPKSHHRAQGIHTQEFPMFFDWLEFPFWIFELFPYAQRTQSRSRQLTEWASSLAIVIAAGPASLYVCEAAFTEQFPFCSHFPPFRFFRKRRGKKPNPKLEVKREERKKKEKKLRNEMWKGMDRSPPPACVCFIIFPTSSFDQTVHLLPFSQLFFFLLLSFVVVCASAGRRAESHVCTRNLYKLWGRRPAARETTPMTRLIHSLLCCSVLRAKKLQFEWTWTFCFPRFFLPYYFFKVNVGIKVVSMLLPYAFESLMMATT